MKFKTIFAASVLLFLAMLSTLTTQAQIVGTQKAERQKNIPKYLPDLVVTGLEVLNSDTGKLQATVMNKGKGRAETCELRLIVWDSNGKAYALIGMGQFPINPNEKQTVVFDVEKPVSSMKYELFTDYTKKISESNELNNIYKGYIGKY